MPEQNEGAAQEGNGSFFNGHAVQLMFQMLFFTMAMNFFTQRNAQTEVQQEGLHLEPAIEGSQSLKLRTFSNVFGPVEDCDLFIHFSSTQTKAPPLPVALNKTRAIEEGYELLWHQGVWYEASAEPISTNVSIGPLSLEALVQQKPSIYLHATLLKRSVIEASKGEKPETISEEQVVQQSLPLVAQFRELDDATGAANLFGSDEDAPIMPAVPSNSSGQAKLPYFKTKIEIRPVFDQTVINGASAEQGPFKKLKKFPDLGLYQPYLYLSDFWLLEKDYVLLNATLVDRPLNLTLSYSVASLFVWSMQAQMADQWMVQGEWGLTDTQRDSFMLKRLYLDTNPYFLAFSAAFLGLHMVFSMLAFKNDIQFWRNNESMQGLSARSMVVSFVCQLITALYLLDSRETSRLILFEIILDTGLAFWKLRKAVKVELSTKFPFVHLGGQEGYDKAGTNKYDEEALRYMGAIITPLFIGYAIRSALYGKHRGWYSFFVSTAAGGVYTFGFAMMTPQLYINYKLKSVEHLPWRALTYKAMNTFVDDVAAFLIDMPLMHRLSVFRDDIVFFVYIYQRWKYRVDKTRPSVWVGEDGKEADALPAEASEETTACPKEAPLVGTTETSSADKAAPTDAEGLARRKKTTK